MSEEYDLKKSEKIGQLYPVILDKFGHVIDGKHRLEADPKWRTEKLDGIDSEEKLLVARAVANWHRREVPREEKEEWINGLAKIYLKQGLKIKGKRYTFEDGNTTTNEIFVKITEVTSLNYRRVDDYLSSEFKQMEQSRTKQRLKIPASERIEHQLGEEYVERFRKEVLEEQKLSPEEKRKKEEEKQKRKEDKEKKREEKIQKEAEERAKNLKTEELLKDKEFVGEVTKKFIEQEKTAKSDEGKKLLQELGIPSVGEQIEQFYERIGQIPNNLSNTKPTNPKELTLHILGILKNQSLKCPVCGETAIQWRCGHDF